MEDLIPVANADSREYWEGARAGKLKLRRCRDCGKLHFMPRFLCPFCWSENLEWIDSAGRGTVHSFTIIRRAPLAEFVARVPYVVALIDLEEGPRMMANILGNDALETRIGDPVRVTFEERRGDMTLPQFKLSRTN